MPGSWGWQHWGTPGAEPPNLSPLGDAMGRAPGLTLLMGTWAAASRMLVYDDSRTTASTWTPEGRAGREQAWLRGGLSPTGLLPRSRPRQQP